MAFDLPHPPAEPDPPRSFVENPLLPQGIGLAAIAVVALWGLRAAGRRSFFAGVVVSPLLLMVAFLAAWASAIHLTGGEKFDDHPWV